MTGIVVYDYECGICYPGFETWSILGHGILVKSKQAGMIHYVEPDMDLELKCREKETTDLARNERLIKYCNN